MSYSPKADLPPITRMAPILVGATSGTLYPCHLCYPWFSPYPSLGPIDDIRREQSPSRLGAVLFRIDEAMDPGS